MTKIKTFPSPDETIRALAKFIIRLANNAIKKDGSFSIALSGGNTPKKLFELLATDEYRNKIDWQKTLVAWSDERFVPPSSSESNVGMAMKALLDHVPIPANQILLPDTALVPEDSAWHYEKLIRSIFKAVESFHLVLLGLGEDGHTASLFPGTDILEERTALVKSVYVPQISTYRLSFTVKLINQAKNVAFLVTGNQKSAIVDHLLNHDQPSYPARLIHPKKGNLYWYLDAAAASKLNA